MNSFAIGCLPALDGGAKIILSIEPDNFLERLVGTTPEWNDRSCVARLAEKRVQSWPLLEVPLAFLPSGRQPR